MSAFSIVARSFRCIRYIPTTKSLKLRRIHLCYTTMSQVPSKACCNTPPIVTTDYKEKGKFDTVAGLKTYVTGPSSAKKGVLVVYDIFGYFPQTLQGADIIATSDHENEYQVFMPDFFEGKPADISWYPPDTDEKGKKLGNFFETTAAPPANIEKLQKVMKELKSNNPQITKWGVLGYCWGGKIVNLTSQENSPFNAAASAHPAMVDANDAPGITIPFLMLPSKDESKEDVEKWQAGVKTKPNYVRWFDNQIHGFMAARGDLNDKEVVKDYEKAYHLVLSFFNENFFLLARTDNTPKERTTRVQIMKRFLNSTGVDKMPA